MNALIITVILVGGIVGGVALLENFNPLWKWIEKQDWWKEIVGE